MKAIKNKEGTPDNGSHLILLILLLVSLKIHSQAEVIPSADSLPLDKSVRMGRLKNGLTYYIKSVAEPQSKLYMNFYIKAGSNDSEKEQINISHALEHLVYKPTKNFPEGISQSKAIMDLGMTIYDLKAISSRKSTDYYFDAPAHNPKAIQIGLDFFKDIANGILVTDEDFAAVKGELRQEYLLKVEDPTELEAETRLQSKIFPCSHDYTDFVKQQAAMDINTVRSFYRDHYRPDRMAVSIIGNIDDIESVESKITKVFGDLKNPEISRKRKNCDSLYFLRPPQFFVVKRKPTVFKPASDKLVKIQMFYRDPKTFYNLSNSVGLKGMMLMDLLSQILDWRFSEMNRTSNSLIISNENMYKSNMRSGLLVEMEGKDQYIESQFKDVLEVLVQLQKLGITKEELGKLKLVYSQFLQSRKIENPKYWQDQIFVNYVLGEAFPRNKKLIYKKFLSDLTLDDFNAFLASLLSSGPDDIGIIAPYGTLASNWTEDEVRSWIKDEQKSPTKNISYSKAPENFNLLNEVQQEKLESDIEFTVHSREQNIKELRLENGLTLVVQSIDPTSEMDEGEMVFNAFSKNGVCGIPEEDSISALYAPEIVMASGVNDFSNLQIEQYLEENGMFPGVISFYTGYNKSGFQVFGPVDRMEKILQLLYLYLTEPNENDAAFEQWKETKIQSASNIVVNEFNRAVKEKTGDPTVIEDFFGRKILSEGVELNEKVNKIELGAALENYRRFFGNAKDFTVVVSGDFEIDSVIPSLVKYLGHLPSEPSKETICTKEVRKNLPNGPKTFTISTPPKAGLKNVKYQWKFIKAAGNSQDWRDQLKVEVLAKLTNIRAWDLRFKQGFAIYDVRVWGRLNKDLNRYEVSSILDLVPDQFPTVKEEVHEIIKELKTDLVSQEDLARAVQYVSRGYRLDGSPGTIQVRNEMLLDHYEYGGEILDPEELKSYLNSLTSKEIRNFARQIYRDKNFYEFVMMENEL